MSRLFPIPGSLLRQSICQIQQLFGCLVALDQCRVITCYLRSVCHQTRYRRNIQQWLPGSMRTRCNQPRNPRSRWKMSFLWTIYSPLLQLAVSSLWGQFILDGHTSDLSNGWQSHESWSAIACCCLFDQDDMVSKTDMLLALVLGNMSL